MTAQRKANLFHYFALWLNGLVVGIFVIGAKL